LLKLLKSITVVAEVSEEIVEEGVMTMMAGEEMAEGTEKDGNGNSTKAQYLPTKSML
jgi:hypothetical protein